MKTTRERMKPLNRITCSVCNKKRRLHVEYDAESDTCARVCDKCLGKVAGKNFVTCPCCGGVFGLEG